ncbi:S1C family serine protease [Corynebacterium gerontici]|uniref:Periplasmic pH-dependent serine endoprotease DegQ n=1 Tax=Corynebacterium gerontici TaxID=2079234 RepID=A0A3G6IZT6_9CORY|nr:trypsin-like peptidase domain-containing protein [Corynebacterium gerontici]AZA11023.1 Periplasmic pH-dependent serine endoprotease DegQ precursor [Corynebacterium gerontici]
MTATNDPHNLGEHKTTQEFGRIQSPYSKPHSTEPSEDTQNAWQAQPVPVQQRSAKTMKMSSAIALALVGALVAGGVGGVVGSQVVKDQPSSVIQNLEAPVQNSTGEPPAEGSVEGVAAKVLPAVVSIQVLSRTSGEEGSGSIISPDGYVLTNNHVVAAAEQGGAKMTVMLNDGTQYDADLVAGDPNTDVAVIKLRGAQGLPTMNFGDSSKLAVGQEVVAVGSPLGLSATVTSGIVSALNRPVRAAGANTGQSSLIDAIQTDAAINPGNSGGPLVDMQGNLIGMNSMIASLSNGQDAQAGSIGLGFAIPADFARRVAKQLIDTGEATQPMIGVEVAANANVRGALVSAVKPGGPGDRAGIKPGDLITRVNDRTIESADGLVAAVRSSDFGETVTLEVSDENGSNSHTVEVTLTSE